MSDSNDPVYYTAIATPDGSQAARVPLTSSDNQCDKNILCKPPWVIPVLFLPGLMGSNLMKGNGKVAWRPPNKDARGAADLIAQLFEYLFKTTKKRAKELKTSEAKVDPRGSISEGDSGLSENVLRARGWGTVLRTSYHPLMAKLQSHLNNLSRFIPASGAVEFQAWAAGEATEAPTEWGTQSGEALTPEEILHAAEYQFDVWGGGYNWLQSNGISGKDIQDYIEKTVLPYYNDGKAVEVKTGDGPPCKIQRPKPSRPVAEKVIIVTHSMGGLVSRALTENHQYDKVLGVSHGVQPATGAPDTYKRMRAGADGIAQLFLGRNAADLTAILTQAQGGMELLPMADYNGGKPWLRVRDKAMPEDEDSGIGISLPAKGDPYEEIYKSPEWYGLVPSENEKLMNPAGGDTGKSEVPSKPEQDDLREPLDKMIKRVQEFHADIQGKYQVPTYVHYGHQGKRGETGSRGGLFADSHRFAFGQVVWEGSGGSQVTLDAMLLGDDQNGKIELANGVSLHIAKADASGDGTVPWQSGAAPEGKTGVAMVFAHGQGCPGSHNDEFGYDHQEACNDDRALYATLYAIIKIAQNAQWHKKESE
jgi:hypothetical protein